MFNDPTFKITYIIIILFIIIGMICISFIVIKSVPTITEKSNNNQIITIENHTQIPQIIIFDRLEITLPPYETSKLPFSPEFKNIKVKSLNFDGNTTIYSALLSGFNNKKLLLTYHGIYDNSLAIEGVLSNRTSFPVIFVEYGSNGRRWPVAVVGPGSSVIRLIVSQTKWEIVHPSDENNPLATVYTLPNTKELVYDGKNIIPLIKN